MSVTPATSPHATPKDAAFSTMALPLLPAMTRLARALMGNASDADDVVQETFLRAFRYWHSFDQATDCRLWLARICRNVVHDLRRRSAREFATDDAELEALASVRVHKAAVTAGLGDMYSRLDLRDAIHAALARLDPVFRDVVVLSEVEGFSYEEISDLLGIPIGTVRSRLYRGRRHLQEDLMTFALDAGYASATGRKSDK